MLRPALALLVAMIILSALLPAAAEAASRRVCAKSAIVRDTPRGFAIARVYRNQRLRIVRVSGERGWTPVSTAGGLPGWILTRSLCRG